MEQSKSKNPLTMDYDVYHLKPYITVILFQEKWPKKQRFKVTKNFWAWNVCQCQFFWGVMVFVGERVRATCKQKHFTEFARDLSRPNWKARTWLVSVIVIHNWYVSQVDTFLATHEWNNKCVLDIETKHCRCKNKDLLLVLCADSH